MTWIWQNCMCYELYMEWSDWHVYTICGSREEIKWSLNLARECKGHVLKVKYTLPQEAQATKKNKVQRTRERSIACVTSAMVHSEPLRPVQPIPPGRKHNSPCQKNTSTSCTSPHWYSGFYAQRASCEMTCWIRAIISHAFIMLTSWEKR